MGGMIVTGGLRLVGGIIYGGRLCNYITSLINESWIMFGDVKN